MLWMLLTYLSKKGTICLTEMIDQTIFLANCKILFHFLDSVEFGDKLVKTALDNFGRIGM